MTGVIRETIIIYNYCIAYEHSKRRALAKGLRFNIGDRKHPCVCRRTKLSNKILTHCVTVVQVVLGLHLPRVRLHTRKVR